MVRKMGLKFPKGTSSNGLSPYSKAVATELRRKRKIQQSEDWQKFAKKGVPKAAAPTDSKDSDGDGHVSPEAPAPDTAHGSVMSRKAAWCTSCRCKRLSVAGQGCFSKHFEQFNAFLNCVIDCFVPIALC